MAKGGNPYESMPTAEHVAAAFQAKKPNIVIAHNLKVRDDSALAGEVAKWLRDRGFESVTTLHEIMEENMLPGQDWELEYRKNIGRCTHLIEISQTERTQGLHNKAVRIIRNDVEEQLEEWQEAIFKLTRNAETSKVVRELSPVAISSLGQWNTDAGKRAFLIRMMDLGVDGDGQTLRDAGRTRIGTEIDWSDAEFAHLLGKNVTVQDVDPEMVKDFDDPERIKKMIIVDMGQSTAHGETISGAFKIEEGFQHGMETNKPPIICNCAQCGAGRQAFVLDKSGVGSEGVLIIPNTKHEGCDVTANISPVPGNTLKKVLNEMFAR